MYLIKVVLDSVFEEWVVMAKNEKEAHNNFMLGQGRYVATISDSVPTGGNAVVSVTKLR